MKKDKEDRTFVAMVSKAGYCVSLPFVGTHGNAEVLLSEGRWGFLRGSKHGKRHVWEFMIRGKLYTLFSPGKWIEEKQLDPVNQRVIKDVNFHGKIYTFHSGFVASYYEKHPKERKVKPMWIPDERHQGDENVLPVPMADIKGEPNDIVEILQLMYDIRNDFTSGMNALK